MSPFKSLFWPDTLPIWSDIAFWEIFRADVCYEIKTINRTMIFVIRSEVFQKANKVGIQENKRYANLVHGHIFSCNMLLASRTSFRHPMQHNSLHMHKCIDLAVKHTLFVKRKCFFPGWAEYKIFLPFLY